MKTSKAQPSHVVTRRRFLSRATAGATAAVLFPMTRTDSRAAGNEPRAFRFGFMPCIHLRRDWRSPAGFAAALQAVGKLTPAPEFVLTGGDMCQNLRDQSR